MTPERRLEILTKTRALIERPWMWGQGTLSQHTIVDRFLMRPPALCLMGAVMKAANGTLEYSAEVWQINDYLGGLLSPEEARSAYGEKFRMMCWNDRHEHHEVLGLVDLAIMETWLELSPDAEQPHDDGNNRQHDEDCPQHGSTDTPARSFRIEPWTP